MTDKQIIDCEHLEAGEIKFCNALNVSFYSDFLCNKGNCIILKLKKQLKAKEQECEQLKNFHINLVGVKECEIKELAELKLANKHLNDLLNQALKELEKARETLTEIKEFFNEECIICKENYINITGEICEECKYKDILQKISECEVNDE